tara:strand:- start:164 stop:706 length:543 start_codon:yes stop_codon:yes gene_type:complete
MKLLFLFIISIFIISCSNNQTESKNENPEDLKIADTLSETTTNTVIEVVEIDTVKRYPKSEVNEITSHETGVYTRSATLKENGVDTQIPVNGIVYDMTGDRVKYEANYKNGKLDGFQKRYHFNGNLKSEEPYINGERHGKYTAWSKDGKVLSEIVYENSMIISKKRWDDEGNLLEEYNAK